MTLRYTHKKVGIVLTDETQLNTNRLKVEVTKILFCNKDKTWGIFSVEPSKENVGFGFQPKLNYRKNFVIKGNIPIAMNIGQEYDVEVTDLKSDPKYGEFYEIVRFHMEALNTVEAQQRFLRAIVTDYLANLIISAFPNAMLVDDIDSGVINLVSIYGIGVATANKVKDDIERNKDIGALMGELVDLNFTANMIKKIVDKFKGATMALFKVKESLYNLCYVSGISFKRVDAVALLRGEDRFGHKRIRAYSEYCFDEIANQGHSWVSERVFLEKAIEDLGIIGTYIRDYMNSEEGQELFFWQQSDKRISSKRMYNNERNTLKNLLRLASKYQAPVGFNVEEAILKAEAKLCVEYTEEQKNAIIESVNHGVFVLNGKGGTGKTTVIKGIVEVIESLGLAYQACALSGKASQVLLSKDIESATIHRTFSIGLDDVGGDRYLEFDVIIIDESSMINASLFSVLLSKIKNGAKVIIVGDSGQLSAIGHGDILRDLLRTQFFKTIELLQIHRQAKDSGIIEVASLIRDGKQICSARFEEKSYYGVKNDMVLFGYQDKEAIPLDLERVLKGYSKTVNTPKDLLDIQIVVATKERGNLSARAVNILAQGIFNDLSKEFISSNGYDYRDGDKVIVKGNSYEIDYYDSIEKYYEAQEEKAMKELSETTVEYDEDDNEIFSEVEPLGYKGDLFNGTMGIVKSILNDVDTDGNVTKLLAVEFEGLGVVVFNSSKLDTLDLAYAVTCHRLQGSTIKNVIVALDYSAYSLLSRQWVYTAITRASKKCVLLVESSALVKAIGTDASGGRQTFLGDMIDEIVQKIGNLETIINK